MIRLIVLLALVVSISAHAQTTITTVGNPASLWAIAPDEKDLIDTAALKRLRAEGVNALIVDAQSVSAARVLALRSLAKKMKMWLVVVVPQQSRTAAARRALALCRVHAANIRCAASAGSLARARTMAHKADGVRPFVALYASSPSAASQFETLRWARRHIVVIAPLYKSFNSLIWGRAIGSAAISPAVDLAVAPVAGLSSSSVRRFGATLASGKRIAGTVPDVTPPSAPSVTLEAVAASSATVSWMQSVDDVGVAGYRVYVGGSLVEPTTATRTTVSGLACGAAVSISVDAVDASGNASGRATVTATPGPCGGGGGDSGGGASAVSPPTSPTGLSASGVSATAAKLSWTASTDDLGVSGYHLYLGSTEVADVSGTNFTFVGLTCSTGYTLGVAAFDNDGNASGISTRPITTLPCPGDSVAPSTPAGLVTSGIAQSSVTLSWSPSSDNVAVTGYRLLNGGSQVASSTGTSFVFTGLSCGTSYNLGVASEDAAGNVSATATTTATTSVCPDAAAPSTPTGLAASGVGQTSAGLTWNASIDNVGVTGYRIFQNGSQMGTSFSPSYLLGGLTCATAYAVGVAAVDGAGNVSATATTTVTTTACPDTAAPSTPTGLVTSAVGATSATLSWSPSTDNVSVSGYRLYRGLSQVGTSSSTTFTYSGLTCGTSYALGVAAVDGAGNVSGSATTNMTTTACPDTSAPSAPTGLTPSVVGVSSATLSWTASWDNVAVTGYRAFRAGTQVGTTASTSFTVTGMLCGTSYTLGVAAVDAAGNVSASATTTVTTIACPDTSAPSTPTGLATSAVGQTSATLSWSGSSDNVGVVGYRLFRGGSQVGTSSGTAFTYSGLTCGTSYVLGVAAIDGAGNVSATATTGVTSAACPDTVAPSTPTGLGMSAVGQSSATLSWAASSDNVAVTGYRVFRDGTQVGTTASTSFTVTGLTCATSYTLGVAALDAAGNVSATATKALTTTACPDTSAPSVPTGLATSAVGQTSATLSWTASSDNLAVTGYRVFRDGTQVGTAPSTSFDYTALSCGTSYVLGVAAVDAAGNVSAAATRSLTTAVCSDTSAPTTPTGLAAGSVGQTSAGLSWNASTDDVGVTGYRIYQNGSQIGTSLSLSYLLGGLTCGTTYTVGLAAVDGSGNVSGIATLSVTTAACPDTAAPSTPAGLGTSAVTQTSATLSWVASSDNVAVTGYRLFRGASQVGTATPTSFAYMGLTCGTSYVLGVAAVDAAGNVSATATISLITAACPDTSAPSTPAGLAASAVGQTSAALSWTASSDNVAVTGYRVFRAGTQVGTTSSTTFTVTGLTCATSYTLGVAALDAAGNVSATATTSVSTPACPDTSAPSTPAGLAASGVAQASATLSWSASTDNVGVTGYRVFRGSTQVGTPSTTSFAFSGLTCGTTYALGVAAVDAAGNVSATATTSVTTSPCPDTTAPSTPTGLSSSGTGQTSVALSWIASTDNVGVSGYRLYQNGTQVGTSSSVGYIFGGLTCATSYSFGVAAVDGAGNVSVVASLSVTTLGCADSVAPSVPVGLSAAGFGQTGGSLSWGASSDNVGVVGYRVYLNGVQVGTSSSTSYSFAGLVCATGYGLGVAAFDAAGNVSLVASVSVTTAACSGGGGQAASVAVSPSGSDSTCARGDLSRPCATPAKAWSLAQAGDTIAVADGSYTSGCSLLGGKSSDVTFSGSAAAKFVCSLAFPASVDAHAVIDGISLYQFDSNGANYVTIKNGAVTCQDAAPYVRYTPDNFCSAKFSINSGSQHWLVQNLSIGPSYDSESVCGGNSPNISTVFGNVNDITFRNVVFHDVRYGCAAQHTENLRVDALSKTMSNITFDGVTFTNGANSGLHGGGGGPDTSALFLTGPGTLTGLVIQNSLFAGEGNYGIDGAVDLNITNSNVRNNTIVTAAVFQCDSGHCPGGYSSTFKITSNISANQECMIGPAVGSSGGSLARNLWYYNGTGGSASQCGSTNTTASGSNIVGSIFNNYTGNDYTLKTGSAAINSGSTTSGEYTTTDKNGLTRPCGTAPDTGAYERCP